MARGIDYCPCCGEGFSAYSTIVIHFVIVILLLVEAIGSIINEDPSLNVMGLPMPIQLAVGAYAMAAVPFCLAGLYGAYHRIESTVRVYWYFLIMTYIAVVCWVILDLVNNTSCRYSSKPLINGAQVFVNSQSSSATHEAFGCGVGRTVSIVFAVITVAAPAHFIASLWVFMKDMQVSTGPGGLGELVYCNLKEGGQEAQMDKIFGDSGLEEQVGLLSGERPTGEKIFGRMHYLPR